MFREERLRFKNSRATVTASRIALSKISLPRIIFFDTISSDTTQVENATILAFSHLQSLHTIIMDHHNVDDNVDDAASTVSVESEEAAPSLPASDDLNATPVDDKASSVTPTILDPPEDFICPITQEIFRHPVQDILGHTYERSAILAWLAANGTCPLTRRPMRPSSVITNVHMKLAIETWRKENGIAELTPVDSDEDSTSRREDDDGEYDDDDNLFGYIFADTSLASRSDHGTSFRAIIDPLMEEYERIVAGEDQVRESRRERRRQVRAERREAMLRQRNALIAWAEEAAANAGVENNATPAQEGRAVEGTRREHKNRRLLSVSRAFRGLRVGATSRRRGHREVL